MMVKSNDLTLNKFPFKSSMEFSQTCIFVVNLDNKMLLGDNATATIIKRFISTAVRKMYKLHTSKLPKALWLTGK